MKKYSKYGAYALTIAMIAGAFLASNVAIQGICALYVVYDVANMLIHRKVAY